MTAGCTRTPGPGSARGLLDQRFDQLGEAVPGPIQAALHGPQITAGYFRDFLVTLALELAQHEHYAMMLGQLADTLLDGVLEEPLAIEIIGPRRRVFKLQRTMIGFPVALDRLEEHQRIAAAIAQLVFRQVRGDRVDPGRKLLRLVEAMQVPEHADEHLLYEVFCALTVPDSAVDETQQPALVAIHQRAEGLWVARQMPLHDMGII